MSEKILKPAIRFFNGLSFRHKIITIFSTLAVLLILPSISIGKTCLHKMESYQKQRTALFYIEDIHRLITQVQLHRGLLNSYIQNQSTFRPKLLENEKRLKAQIKSIAETDRKSAYFLSIEGTFSEIARKIERIYLPNIASLRYPMGLFNAHTDIVTDLIHLIQIVADHYGFGSSEAPLPNHLATILTSNLLQLQELTGRLRGLATGLIDKRDLTSLERNRLMSLYIHINSLIQQPINTTITADIEASFPHIVEQKALTLYQLHNILFIVRHNIIEGRHEAIVPERFFRIVTDAIETQTRLYDTIASTYAEQLAKAQQRLYRNFALIVVGFILIILTSIYLAAAFYRSVLSGIAKLETASNLITEGKTNIHLETDSTDEIAHALKAFNRMSERLDRHISFLDSYKFAIDHAAIVSKTDPDGRITYVNDRFCQISGFSKEELLGKTHALIHHPDTPDEQFRQMWQTIKHGRIWLGKVKNRSSRGETYIVNLCIVPIFDHRQDIVEFIAISHDITQLERSKEQIQEEMRKQQIDTLTGLPRRSQLIKTLQKMHRPVLLYFDIDHFSGLNDFYGTFTGDRVLQYVAKLLQQKLHGHPHIYKVQSNGFAVAFEEDQLPCNAERLLEDLIDFIEAETRACEASVCVSITLSGSIVDYRACANYDNLLSYLITARKMAKKEHRKFLTYSSSFSKEKDYQNNIEWINKIKEALDEDRITTFYQPIVDTQSGAVCKYEALVRLIEPSGKVVSPYFFLDIAKKAKLYTRITRVVFDKTFATFYDKPHYHFSLNISFEDIADEEIAGYILEKIAAFPHPECIILEITESEQIENYRQIDRFIQEAKQRGVQIAIDDFGSGYSNFDHVLGLSADYIKIDGSLIKNITENEASRIISEAIIAFSKKLGAKTVVEFVHNESVYTMVREMGADFAQGYHLGEPNPYLLKEEFRKVAQTAEAEA